MYSYFNIEWRKWLNKTQCNIIPLYQVITGLGTPVTLQASLTVCPSSAVQFARISTKSGGPIKADSSWRQCLKLGVIKEIIKCRRILDCVCPAHSMQACCIAAVVLGGLLATSSWWWQFGPARCISSPNPHAHARSQRHGHHPPPSHSHRCYSTATGWIINTGCGYRQDKDEG